MELQSLRSRLAQLSPQTSHSIYKVPGHLRNVNSKAFEPEMVAIGPYNRGNPKLKEMEEVKLRYMQALLVRKPDVPLEYYISAIDEEMSKKARDCYAEQPINLDSGNQFTDMLVLDGCFIIEVTQCRDLFKRTFPDRSSLGFLQRDLILMENQIPFFVLCKLFDHVEGPKQHSLLIERVLLFYRDVFPAGVLYRATTMRSSEEVQHILDLIHSNWCPPNSYDHHTTSVPVEGCCIISCNVIPSASELKDANVKFCNKNYDSAPDSEIIFWESRRTSLFDVEFKDDCGRMVMPTLVIDDGTESLLRNLIAYEQLFPPNRPTCVVDYMVLLDNLINTSKDVQILCGGKIIENLLGSDQEVVNFVNRLGEGVVFYSNRFMYADTFRHINAHHQKCWNRAVAAFHRDYFNTPWAYIAFLAAFILFLLTAAQTIFSALQFCEDIFPGKILYEATTMRSSKEVQHILHLIHNNWYPPNSSDHHTISVPVQGYCCASCCPNSTLSPSVIPSASELKDANVKFLNKEYDSSPDSNIIFREGNPEYVGYRISSCGICQQTWRRRINVHHQKCWNRAVAAFHRDYFNTPWAYIAFLGALILLLLAAAQTAFSALQVFKTPDSHH